MLFCTIYQSLAFVVLFTFLDLTFLLLAIEYLHPNASNAPNINLIKSGGYFGILSAFTAWYIALSGVIADEKGQVTHRLPYSTMI